MPFATTARSLTQSLTHPPTYSPRLPASAAQQLPSSAVGLGLGTPSPFAFEPSVLASVTHTHTQTHTHTPGDRQIDRQIDRQSWACGGGGEGLGV